MTLSELYEKLEIETPKELEYFEQFADLIEMPEKLEFDLFYIVLSELDAETAGELTENYFEDLINAVPDEENELVSLLDSIEQNLLSLAEGIENDDNRRSFAQQLYRFRNWYTDGGGALADGIPMSILDAVFTAREGKLTGEDHSFDFSRALDYKLDDAQYGIGAIKKIDITAEG